MTYSNKLKVYATFKNQLEIINSLVKNKYFYKNIEL